VVDNKGCASRGDTPHSPPSASPPRRYPNFLPHSAADSGHRGGTTLYANNVDITGMRALTGGLARKRLWPGDANSHRD
jgi:hypothetical protein